jgi:predicted Co/Zn/Cd cation transporter (cation efflux family)
MHGNVSLKGMMMGKLLVSTIFVTVSLASALAWPLVGLLTGVETRASVVKFAGCWSMPVAVMATLLVIYVATCIRLKAYWYLCVPVASALFLYNGYIAVFVAAACEGRAM